MEVKYKREGCFVNKLCFVIKTFKVNMNQHLRFQRIMGPQNGTGFHLSGIR